MNIITLTKGVSGLISPDFRYEISPTLSIMRSNTGCLISISLIYIAVDHWLAIMLDLSSPHGYNIVCSKSITKILVAIWVLYLLVSIPLSIVI